MDRGLNITKKSLTHHHLEIYEGRMVVKTYKKPMIKICETPVISVGGCIRGGVISHES